MRAEIAVFVLNLSDIIFLRTAPHTDLRFSTVRLDCNVRTRAERHLPKCLSDVLLVEPMDSLRFVHPEPCSYIHIVYRKAQNVDSKTKQICHLTAGNMLHLYNGFFAVARPVLTSSLSKLHIDISVTTLRCYNVLRILKLLIQL